MNFDDCGNCGLTFANPMPSDDLISQGNAALVRLYHQGKSFSQEFREARQSYLRGKMFARTLRRWKKHGRFLELGCYQGFFALGVKDNCDWEVETLEIAAPLASFVREKLGLTCHEGTLESAELKQGSYDFVVCHDLIEHINQPTIFLKQLGGLLAPGGRVQILTPNTIQDFAFNRRAHKAGTPPTILLNHIMNFSPTALRLALELSGLRVRKMYCFDIRHALKDFGIFGLGKPGKIPAGPSLRETLQLPERTLLSEWNPARLQELRQHPKTGIAYGIFKEVLPKWFRMRVPPALGIGHEIFAVAERAAP